MSREVKLGCGSWTSFASSCSSTVVQRTSSLWLAQTHQLKQQLRSAQVAGQWRGDIALINTSIVLAAVHGLSGLFRAVSEVEPSLFRPLPLCFYVALRPRRRDNLLGTGTEWERGQGDWLDRGNRPKKTGETVDRRQNNGSVKAVSPRQRLVHCAIALSAAVLDRVTKTMSVAPLLTNNLDNSKQKTSNLLSPAPPPYSWSLLDKSEGPAPPPSSKISWSFDLAWNPDPFPSCSRP